MKRKSNAKFPVTGVHIDGKTEGTLTVTTAGTVIYRPKHGRKEYVVLLSQVAEMVAWKAAKQDA